MRILTNIFPSICSPCGLLRKLVLTESLPAAQHSEAVLDVVGSAKLRNLTPRAQPDAPHRS
jgi:hypothetical protein